MQPYISFSSVSKQFVLQGERTFKELVPNLIKGKSWAKHVEVLKNISFTIKGGETLGIVGKNGAGKSTIMKLIAGVTQPTTGTVSVVGRVAPMIELGAGFHYELTGYENIFLNGAILGMHKLEIEQMLDKIIEFSEIKEFLQEPLKHFSTGMAMRLAFSIAVHAHAQIYLMDEVFAVGDMSFQRKCMHKLEEIKKDKNKIIVFVSHDEEAIKSFCERAILLSHGKILGDGTPTSVFQKYHEVKN